jgi:hypothetical protein
MVDAVDLILLEHAADAVVQLGRRRQVLAERLLDHDARALREACGAERLDRRSEVRRGDREVEDRTLRSAEGVRDPGVQLGVGHVARHVSQPIGQPLEDRLVHRLAGVLDRRARASVDLILPPFPPADAEHRTRQQVPRLEAIQRGQRHLAGEIAGDAEEDERVSRSVHTLSG